MRLNLQVNFANGTAKEITASVPDIVAFESKYDIALAHLNKNPKTTYLLWLAWHAEKRTKATELDFDAWLETVEGMGDNPSDPK